jgi:hypothetical protein
VSKHARKQIEAYIATNHAQTAVRFFEVLLDPGGGFASENAARRFQMRNGRYETVSEVKRL